MKQSDENLEGDALTETLIASIDASYVPLFRWAAGETTDRRKLIYKAITAALLWRILEDRAAADRAAS